MEPTFTSRVGGKPHPYPEKILLWADICMTTHVAPAGDRPLRKLLSC